MSTPNRLELYRCERPACGTLREVTPGEPAPECYDYNPGSKQRFPDGSWLMIGESYTPHGPMVATGTVLDANPLAGYRDDARKAARLEADRPAREAEYEAALQPEPAGVSKVREVRCTSCEHTFSIDVSTLKKGQQVICPRCGASHAQR